MTNRAHEPLGGHPLKSEHVRTDDKASEPAAAAPDGARVEVEYICGMALEPVTVAAGEGPRWRPPTSGSR